MGTLLIFRLENQECPLFPRMLDFLHQVRKRGQCTLDPRLEALLDDDAKAMGL